MGANRRQILAAEPGVHHHYPAWSPDGQWIYFASGSFTGNMDLWRVPSSGGGAERLTQMNTDLRYVVPLNERTVLYVSTDKDGSGPWLWAFHLERKLLTALVLAWRDIRPCPRVLTAGVWWLPCRIRAPASGACRFWIERSRSAM